MPTITRWIGSVINRDPAAPRNDAVVRALDEVATRDNRQVRDAFYRALMESRLMAVRAGAAPEHALETITGPAEAFEFQTLPAQQGRRAIALYTDIDALVLGNKDAQGYVAFEARPLFAALLGAVGGVLINFGSHHFAHLQQADVNALARGEIPALGKRVDLAPATPPGALLEALRAALADDARIVSGHYFTTMMEGQPPKDSCGVKFAPEVAAGDVDLAMRKLVARVARSAPGGSNFDFVLIDRVGPFSRAERMFPPFYTRAMP